MKKTRVNIDDVVCLASDLGLIEAQADDDVAELGSEQLLDRIDEDPEGFLEEYTQALLDHIEVGSSNLTGKEETYKGFGIRINKGNSVQMILKTPV